MTTPFVAALRTRPDVLRTAPAGAADVITVRVEMPEIWDVVRVDAAASDTVRAVKLQALEALLPDDDGFHEDYVMKLRGWEVLDELATLTEAGAVNGSIFLLTGRRRRPVR